MRITTVMQDTERMEFAERAGAHFWLHPGHWSYSDGKGPESGELLALRWGLGNDCVIVLRVGDDEPVIYGQAVAG